MVSAGDGGEEGPGAGFASFPALGGGEEVGGGGEEFFPPS